MLNHLLQGLAHPLGRGDVELFKRMLGPRLKACVDADSDARHDVILDVRILVITITALPIFANRRIAGYTG